MMKELKHTGVYTAILLAFSVFLPESMDFAVKIVSVIFFSPFAMILASCICKYMGWDK